MGSDRPWPADSLSGQRQRALLRRQVTKYELATCKIFAAMMKDGK